MFFIGSVRYTAPKKGSKKVERFSLNTVLCHATLKVNGYFSVFHNHEEKRNYYAQ